MNPDDIRLLNKDTWTPQDRKRFVLGPADARDRADARAAIAQIDRRLNGRATEYGPLTEAQRIELLAERRMHAAKLPPEEIRNIEAQFSALAIWHREEAIRCAREWSRRRHTPGKEWSVREYRDGLIHHRKIRLGLLARLRGDDKVKMAAE